MVSTTDNSCRDTTKFYLNKANERFLILCNWLVISATFIKTTQVVKD